MGTKKATPKKRAAVKKPVAKKKPARKAAAAFGREFEAAAQVDAPQETALVVRTVNADMTSHGGFRWPESGPVEAPDWKPVAACGNGLHGLLDGEGDWNLLNWAHDAKALIVEVIKSSIVAIDSQKVKFPRGVVREVLPLAAALCKVLCSPERIKKLVATITRSAGDQKAGDLAASGDSSRLAASGYSSRLAASGYSSQLAASGYSSQLAASGYSSRLAASGDYSQLAASGDSSQLAASGYSSRLAASGDSSKLAASGDSSQLAASGYSSKLAASGYSSRLAASGDSSQLAASGDSSKLAASGDSSKLAASGDYSIAAGVAPGCVASAGPGGVLVLAWWDGKKPRISVGYIGEDGLEPNVPYCLDAKGRFVKAS